MEVVEAEEHPIVELLGHELKQAGKPEGGHPGELGRLLG